MELVDSCSLAFRTGRGRGLRLDVMPCLLCLFLSLASCVGKADLSAPVTQEEMQAVYEQVCTPVKHGLVVCPENPAHKSDSPSVYRYNGKWYMTWIVFDGKGYETWISESDDLLQWKTLGKVMSFANDSTIREQSQASLNYAEAQPVMGAANDSWDKMQRAGYIALQDLEWGGSYKMQKYDGKYWMSYLGGCNPGYETKPLMIGLASSKELGKAVEWETCDAPIMSPKDASCQWFEESTHYKSCIIEDTDRLTGHRFVIYYNAAGINPENGLYAERIGMAFSDDLMTWIRYPGNPILAHEANHTITGDPQIQKIGDLYVMFYFRAFVPGNPYQAFNSFACSRDLIHWYDWDGESLIYPSEPYDNVYAHKSYVVHWKGVTYHFYCAVNEKDERGIAVATSK